MRKFLCIGLGNFGFHLAKNLASNGCEVLGVDTNREIINNAKDFLSYGVVGDASQKEMLENLRLKEFTGAIVSVGQDMARSIMIALFLKEIGISRIIVRAVSEEHARVLKMIGVTDVIIPERDMAIRLADMLSLKNALDYLPISGGYGILEVTPPRSFIGKTLLELNIAAQYKCQVIGIKNLDGDIDGNSEGGAAGKEKIKIAPSANDIITENCVMIIIGKFSDIEIIQSLK